MTQDELDDQLRQRFISALDKAYEYASEKRDVEALGQLAQLIGSSIDWDKGSVDRRLAMGFKPQEKDDEDE